MNPREPVEPRRLPAETLSRAQRGDRAAVTALVTHLARPVHAMVVRVAGPQRDLVDDAAQDAFVHIVRGLRRFDPQGPARFETWALTVAVRATLDRLRAAERSRRRLVAVDLPPEAVEPRPSPERAADLHQRSARVEAALGTLSAEHRAVLVLRAHHDLDYPEIAAATGLTLGTVKSRLARARAALREALGQEDSDAQ